MSTARSIKTRYSKSDKTVSLKTFARQLAKTDDAVKAWFANKNGVLERASKAKRLETKGSQLAQIRAKVREAKASKKK